MSGVHPMAAPKQKLVLAILACGTVHSFVPSTPRRLPSELSRRGAPKYKGENEAPWLKDDSGATNPAQAKVVDVEDLSEQSFKFIAKVRSKI